MVIRSISRRMTGFSLIEVMVTVLIIMFGILALAGLQGAAINSESDAHQRAQALLLLQDMNDRINANRKNAALYVTNPTAGVAAPRGTGFNGSAIMDCSALSGANLDLCEWHNALLGASEKRGSALGPAIGAMVDARGCVYQLSAAEPQQYVIAVAWKGLRRSAAPAVNCGAGLYDDESFRRVVTLTLTIAKLD